MNHQTIVKIVFEDAGVRVNESLFENRPSMGLLKQALAETPRIEMAEANAFALFEAAGIAAVFEPATELVMTLRLKIANTPRPYLTENLFSGQVSVASAKSVSGIPRVGLRALKAFEFFNMAPIGVVALPSNSYAIVIAIEDQRRTYIGIEWDQKTIRDLLSKKTSRRF
jgi:hypothetical protein